MTRSDDCQPPPDTEEVVASLCALLASYGDSHQAINVPGPAIMQAVLDLAVSTKTEGLLYALLKSQAGLDVKYLADMVLASNLKQLDCTIRVSKLLRDNGINALAFKGCLRANEVYGRIDARRSADVDFLVPRSEYQEACQTLARQGFTPLVSAESKWWHHHLGESPFLSEDGSGMIVDLHNSLQQPGGPYPCDLGAFFRDSKTQRFGGETVHQLSPQHALLVCAISYGKAVREGEPWLSQAHELATCLRQMSDVQKDQMRTLASHQGLSRIYAEAADRAVVLFGASDSAEIGAPNSLELMLSAIGQHRKNRFSRTRELWRWCDGNGTGRVFNFGKAITKVLLRDVDQYREDANGKRALRLAS